MSTYQGLNVYQEALSLADKIFNITKAFPAQETYSLTDQLRRSSRSIGAQLAEAWSKRRYTNHFISKLTDAVAEELETIHWLTIAQQCGYLSSEQASLLVKQCNAIGKMLMSMIENAEKFKLEERNPLK
ncbi:MAG: four helix bundle protein [Cyclobacteriaceae bacterium]